MRWFLVVAVLVFCGGLFAKEHNGTDTGNSGNGQRQEAPKDHSDELYKKISACTDGRSDGAANPAATAISPNPAATPPATAAAASTPSTAGAVTADSSRGSALFTQYCLTCHAQGGSKGPIKDKALAATRVAGSTMPPPKSDAPKPTDEERKAIAAFLAGS